MGLLDQFEQRLDDLLNGALTAAFDDEVQPVEIIAAVTREMDEHLQELSSGRLIAPNHFIVDLAKHDYARMEDHLKTLEIEFAQLATQHASFQNYTLTGDVVITVMQDKELEAGVFRISFEQIATSTSSTTVMAQDNDRLSTQLLSIPTTLAASPIIAPATFTSSQRLAKSTQSQDNER